MFCYYIVFEKKTNFYDALKKEWSGQVIANPTATKLIKTANNNYILDKESNYYIVFLSIKLQNVSKLERFLNKEKVVYDILGEAPKIKSKTNWVNLILIAILLLTLGICLYYKDQLWPQIIEIYRFLRSQIQSKI